MLMVPARAQMRDWEAPPREFSDAARQGFHDGIEAARHDFAEQRRSDVDSHERFRNPPVPWQVKDEYRNGFRRGYTLAVERLQAEMQPPPPPPPAPVYGERPRDSWAVDPDEFGEMARRGFHEGIEGAHRDYDNHRTPDPNNRDEFRSPPVPRQFWDEYREGFRRGYKTAVDHLWGARGPVVSGENWFQVPREFREVEKRGYMDGLEGARRDWDNGRRPTPENRDEYRHPNLPGYDVEAYRAAFRRGYQQGVDHFYNQR